MIEINHWPRTSSPSISIHRFMLLSHIDVNAQRRLRHLVLVLASIFSAFFRACFSKPIGFQGSSFAVSLLCILLPFALMKSFLMLFLRIFIFFHDFFSENRHSLVDLNSSQNETKIISLLLSFCLVETKICVATEKFFEPSYWDGKFNAHESDVKLSCARLVGVFPPKTRFFGAKRHLHWIGWDEEGWQVFALTFSIHENCFSEQRFFFVTFYLFLKL